MSDTKAKKILNGESMTLDGRRVNGILRKCGYSTRDVSGWSGAHKRAPTHTDEVGSVRTRKQPGEYILPDALVRGADPRVHEKTFLVHKDLRWRARDAQRHEPNAG